MFIVAFSLVSELVFSMGKMPRELLSPLNCGNVVGKHSSDATTTTVPYEPFPTVGGTAIDEVAEVA